MFPRWWLRIAGGLSMPNIDLYEQQCGSLCTLCDVTGQHVTANLLDHDLGPLCLDCFAEALRVTTFLRWVAISEGRMP